ncbi:palmitoyltransferase ZDHHC17-like [Mytilus californianus]|uniref:palmitoyltransferase ZDHHC17-like n=1 Tax=Mytilus californianus TaxID=6549 RepID=UPI0022453FB1|nr:palmitoyltransferase ZDHHC17-like [Mytilus californianus]
MMEPDVDPSCNPIQPLYQQEGDNGLNRVDSAVPLQPATTDQQGQGQEDARNYGIVKAVQYGAFGRVQELVEGGYDVNEMDKENVSLLHWASINNRIDIIRYLIDKGAVVDRFGGDLNSTSLHWATRQGHLSTVVLLMSYGADPTILDGEGCRCIHLAAQFGHTAIVAYLIAKGNDVDMIDKNGMTPLMYACHRVFGYDPTRMLLTFGAAVNKTDNALGNTPLHYACLTGNTCAAKLLLDAKAEINVSNHKGQTPIDMAVAAQLPNLVKRLRQISEMRGSGKSNCLTRYTSDKVFRKRVMWIFPFIALFVVGYIPEMTAPVYMKILLALLAFGGYQICRQFFFDENIMNVIPLPLYLATKVWMYYTWIFYCLPYVNSMKLNILFTINTLLLTYNFVKAWKTDPGFIDTNREQKMKTVLDLAETQTLTLQEFCSTCLVHRPLRSKHCGICNKCVAKMDHHCPWIDNCVGANNHKYFIGYLFFLFGMICWCMYGCKIYWNNVVPFDFYEEGITGVSYKLVKNSPWVTWIAMNAAFHFCWVGILLVCQLYQVMWLAMTTNERLNAHRYKYFHPQHEDEDKGVGHSHDDGERCKHQPKSPFNRGPLSNLIDVLGISFFGLLRPNKVDWKNLYDVPGKPENLLRRMRLNVARENYQFV